MKCSGCNLNLKFQSLNPDRFFGDLLLGKRGHMTICEWKKMRVTMAMDKGNAQWKSLRHEWSGGMSLRKSRKMFWAAGMARASALGWEWVIEAKRTPEGQGNCLFLCTELLATIQAVGPDDPICTGYPRPSVWHWLVTLIPLWYVLLKQDFSVGGLNCLGSSSVLRSKKMISDDLK